MNILDRIPAKITELATRGTGVSAVTGAPYEIAVFSLHEADDESNECPLPAAAPRHPLLRYLDWVRNTLPHTLRRRWTGGDSEVLLFDLDTHPSLIAPVAPRWPLSLHEVGSS
jgi:hypothetical protein